MVYFEKWLVMKDVGQVYCTFKYFNVIRTSLF